MEMAEEPALDCTANLKNSPETNEIVKESDEPSANCTKNDVTSSDREHDFCKNEPGLNSDAKTTTLEINQESDTVKPEAEKKINENDKEESNPTANLSDSDLTHKDPPIDNGMSEAGAVETKKNDESPSESQLPVVDETDGIKPVDQISESASLDKEYADDFESTEKAESPTLENSKLEEKEVKTDEVLETNESKPETSDTAELQSEVTEATSKIEKTLDETDTYPAARITSEPATSQEINTDEPDEKFNVVGENETSTSAAAGNTNETSVSEIDALQSINHKRQEEKEVFQKLIDDITRLENELSLKSTANDELKANIDVYKIDLEQEKERAEQHKKEAEELRQELADTNHKLSLALKVEDESGVSPGILDESVTSDGNSAKYEEEISDLRQKVKKLTQNDELKTERVAQLQSQISDYALLMAHLEEEIGSERVETLRQQKNDSGANGRKQENRNKSVQGNAVSPEKQQSGVCSIL